MALDSLDGYLVSELAGLAATISAWQTALNTPETYDWKTTVQQLKAMCTRCDAFVSFYSAGKTAQGS